MIKNIFKAILYSSSVIIVVYMWLWIVGAVFLILSFILNGNETLCSLGIAICHFAKKIWWIGFISLIMCVIAHGICDLKGWIKFEE